MSDVSAASGGSGVDRSDDDSPWRRPAGSASDPGREPSGAPQPRELPLPADADARPDDARPDDARPDDARRGTDAGAPRPGGTPAPGAADRSAGDDAGPASPGEIDGPRPGGTPRPGRGPAGFPAPIVSRGRFRPASPADDTAAWTRPAGSPVSSPSGSVSDGSTPAVAPAPSAGYPDPDIAGTDFFAYTGPPPNNPPPAHWRPPLVNQPLPPSELPEQDHDRLDIEEQAARTLTHGIGLVAGAILVVLLLILCARSIL